MAIKLKAKETLQRIGVRAKSVATAAEVASDLITTRRVIFTPNTEIKDELKNTSITVATP